MSSKTPGKKRRMKASKIACNNRYKAENRHAKSHVRRIKVHLRRYGATNRDHVAVSVLKQYQAALGVFH